MNDSTSNESGLFPPLDGFTTEGQFPLVPLPASPVDSPVDSPAVDRPGSDPHRALRSLLIDWEEMELETEPVAVVEAVIPEELLPTGDVDQEDFDDLAARVTGSLVRIRRRQMWRVRLQVGLGVLAGTVVVAGVVALWWWRNGAVMQQRLADSFGHWSIFGG